MEDSAAMCMNGIAGNIKTRTKFSPTMTKYTFDTTSAAATNLSTRSKMSPTKSK